MTEVDLTHAKSLIQTVNTTVWSLLLCANAGNWNRAFDVLFIRRSWAVKNRNCTLTMSFTDQPQQILPEQHLMLEQPMIRVPYEQLRMAFKSAQRHAERDVSAVLPVIDDIKRGNADDHKIMSVIQRLEKLKSKVYQTLHFSVVFWMYCPCQIKSALCRFRSLILPFGQMLQITDCRSNF